MNVISKRVMMSVAALLAASTVWLWAQDRLPDRTIFSVKVDMVVLSFTVTDNKGKYINNLKPTDFRISEDGIVQHIATFAEGNRPAVQVMDDGSTKPMVAGGAGDTPGKPGLDPRADAFVGTSVFVLFDTSNFMYKGFVYAEDAIADFVRGLDRADSVAVYTFSRNLSRPGMLSKDRGEAILGLRKAVAGDDTALYNALLLTLRDAAKVPGRKVVIVFSNGPDNASMVAPDDVRAVAEDEGIPIYVISTSELMLSRHFRKLPLL
ncbi:MAG: VWA domain-containing protein, partial [Bryobacteraceae bacterium]